MRKTILTALFISSLCVVGAGQTSGDIQSESTTSATSTTTVQTAPNTQPKKTAKHVYTSDDLKPADPNDTPSEPASGISGATSSNGTASAEAPKDDKSGPSKRTKKAGPEAIAAQQAKVDDLKKQADGLTNVVSDIQRLINEQPSRAEGMGAGLQMQQKNLADTQKQLTQSQQQLDAMKSPK